MVLKVWYLVGTTVHPAGQYHGWKVPGGQYLWLGTTVYPAGQYQGVRYSEYLWLCTTVHPAGQYHG